MDSCPSILPKLDMSTRAIEKRNYRVVQREKRRRSFFVHDYIRIKYPQIFNEANGLYLELADKYPGKPDLTKCYYFKKWKKEMTKPINIMIPHLPILTPSELLQRTVQTPEVQPSQSPEVQPPQSPEVQPPQSPEVQPPQSPEVQPPQTPEVQQTIEVQSTEPNGLITGMTLNEMTLMVDGLVNSLQSDRELMDIIEEYDLPDSVWDNQLAIPDYVLEPDLNW